MAGSRSKCRLPLGWPCAVVGLAVVVASTGLVAFAPHGTGVRAAAASGPTTVTGTIQSQRWTPAGSPYVIDFATIAEGATVVVEAGVVVKFKAGGGLDVRGRLIVEGTAAARVVFTSAADDSVGGDTNGDGGATGARRGDWRTIKFLGSSQSSLVNYASIRYGGKQDNLRQGCMYDHMVFHDGYGKLTISNSELAEAQAATLSTEVLRTGASTLVQGNRFATSHCGAYIRSGIFIDNTFEDSLVESAYAVSPSQVSLQYNTFRRVLTLAGGPVPRSQRDVRNNAILGGVPNQPQDQDWSDLSENWWGHVVDPDPRRCYADYPPDPQLQGYTPDGACPKDAQGSSQYMRAGGT